MAEMTLGGSAEWTQRSPVTARVVLGAGEAGGTYPPAERR
jgi:hypothetical protein